MNTPIFSVCAASAAVKSLLGTNPVRFYQFGLAPQGVALPYAVFRTIYGAPENYLDGVPDVDSWGLQIDVYASSSSSAQNVASALRDAIEQKAYVTAWRGDSRDPDTKNYVYSFDVDWILNR